MKVTIYNAVSLDGYIATSEGDTSWVNDLEVFDRALAKANVVIYGRTTYEYLVDSESFPLGTIKNIVCTTRPGKYSEIIEAEFSDLKPEVLLRQLEYQGTQKVIIAGGGHTNASFIATNLVDEVITDVHPILLGSGVKLFEIDDLAVKLELISSKKLNDGIVQIKYKVVKEDVE